MSKRLLELLTEKNIYFLSDAHFGAPIGMSEDDKVQRLIDFGNSVINKGDTLFFLGDLFDFWFEWRLVIPKSAFRVLHILRGWQDKGIDMYYLAGNHDFRLGGFLEREIGFKTFGDCIDFNAGGKKFHLFHGDGVQKSDVGYRILKKVFRNKVNQKLFMMIHPDFGIKMADWSSSKSRESQVLKNPSKAEDDYFSYAQQKIEEGFDYILMGHTHRPLVKKLGNGCYLNTGNWYSAFSYGKFDGKELTLHYFGDRSE